MRSNSISLTTAALTALWTIFLCSGRIHADTSLGFDILGGVGTHGFDTTGTLDLKPDPDRRPWETSVTYAHEKTTLGTESETNELTLGLSHAADDSLENHGSLNFWKDTINDVKYFGPSVGFTYTWLNGEASQVTSSKIHDEDNDDTPGEIAAVTLDLELNFYETDVVASSRTIIVKRKRVIVPGGTGALHDTQLHPNANIEKPLFDQSVTPFLDAGHYFYSKDPAAIEAIAGRPRFASSAGQFSSLVGGFLNNDGDMGVRLALPADVLASFKLGADQTATDNAWATIQDITLSRRFWEKLKAQLEWTRTIQDGTSSDLFSGGLTYYFN